jgi:Mor family transcriptional regulator
MTQHDQNPATAIEEEVRAAAASLAIESPVLADLSRAIASRVMLRFAGQRVYFAGLRKQQADRDAVLRARFTGSNLRELARESGITPRQMRKIVTRKS